MDAGTDTTEEVRYRTVDVATATLGTERVIESSLTIGSTVQSICGITVAESGRIYVTWSTQSAISAYYSDDAGANWNSIASPLETATQEDFILLFPANGTGDDDDCCCIFHDKSADEISLKMYDASGDSWTETSIETSVPDNSQFRQFDGTVRHSDGHIILVYVDTDAFDCVDLNPNSIASPGVTALTSVGTSITGPHSVGILINQQNNDIYASYMRGTVGSALSVYYKLSDDDGATWETEAAMSEDTAENLHGMGSGRTVGSAGGRWQPVWFDSDDADIFINLTNDVEIAAVVAQSNAPRSLYYHLVGGGR